MFPTSSVDRYEDAYELCQEALQIFKMNKKWDRAAVASMQGAKMQELLGVKHEAASCFIEAYKMMKKVDAKAAIEPLEKAVMLFASLSRFQFASKWSLQIGEIYEKDVVDLKKAIEFYENAVQYAEMSGEDSSRNKAEVKVATLAAADEQYQKALELFEVIADRMVDNNLLKFSCKEYYLKAGLCSLCLGDVVGAKVSGVCYVCPFSDSLGMRIAQDLTICRGRGCCKTSWCRSSMNDMSRRPRISGTRGNPSS